VFGDTTFRKLNVYDDAAFVAYTVTHLSFLLTIKRSSLHYRTRRRRQLSGTAPRSGAS
jgi:hypothetical protein